MKKDRKERTFFGRLLSDIASLFGGILKHTINGAEKDYNNLSQEDKDSLIHGAGILTFISQEIGKEPAIIRDQILEEFPDIDAAQLEHGLYTIAKAFNLAPEANNLDDTIAKIQEHLKVQPDSIWGVITQTAASIFSIAIAPAGTKLKVAFDLVKFVYLKIFKK